VSFAAVHESGRTKKRGFKNLAEYEAVAANISMVVISIDPQTKEFTDPQAAIKKELEDVSADKTITVAQKKTIAEGAKCRAQICATNPIF
jgi:hypothetical protein